MLVVPGGPAQAQFWIDEEKRRRRFERLKQSRKTNRIHSFRKKLRTEAIEELKNQRKDEIKKEIIQQIDELVTYRDSLFSNFGNMHISASKVQKDFENVQLKKELSLENVKRIIKKSHLEMQREKQRKITNDQFKINRKSYLAYIERFRASIQARKGRKLLKQSNKKPIESKPKYKSSIILPSPESKNLKQNAEILLKSIEPTELKSKESGIIFERNRRERGIEALKHIRQQQQCAKTMDELDKQAKIDMHSRKQKYSSMPQLKKSFARVIFEPKNMSVEQEDVIELPEETLETIISKESSDDDTEDKNLKNLSVKKDEDSREIIHIPPNDLPAQIYEKDNDYEKKKDDSGIYVTRSSEIKKTQENEMNTENRQLGNNDEDTRKNEVKNIFKLIQKQISDSKYVQALTQNSPQKLTSPAKEVQTNVVDAYQLSLSPKNKVTNLNNFANIQKPIDSLNLPPVSNFYDEKYQSHLPLNKIELSNVKIGDTNRLDFGQDISIDSANIVDSSSQKSSPVESKIIEKEPVKIEPSLVSSQKISEISNEKEISGKIEKDAVEPISKELPFEPDTFHSLSAIGEVSESQFYNVSLHKSTRSHSISGISMPDSTSFLLDAYRRNSLKNQPWKTPSNQSFVSGHSSGSAKSKLSGRLSQLLTSFNKQRDSISFAGSEKQKSKQDNSIQMISQKLSDSKFNNSDDYQIFSVAEEEKIIKGIDERIDEYTEKLSENS